MLCNTNCDGANFDFSAFPLWCGSFDMNVDERFIAQLAYHFCRLKNNSKEIIALQKQMVGLANKFHRIENGEVKKI
jgi:hypothetical protein